MLTDYEKHLFESLVTVQELLIKTMDNKDRLETEVEKLKADDHSWYRHWQTEKGKTEALEKELAELKVGLKKGESDAATSNSSEENNLKEVI